jgi:bifunctional DNA-binding transcriptional regulator/antitoxin component of YhaV-PrlF toxin-antitoxin module
MYLFAESKKIWYSYSKEEPMASKLLKISSKNQITLPKKIIERFPNTEYFEIEAIGNEVVLRPAAVAPLGGALSRVREKMAKLGISEDIIGEAISYARAGDA